jgi:hypothetical protein
VSLKNVAADGCCPEPDYGSFATSNLFMSAGLYLWVSPYFDGVIPKSWIIKGFDLHIYQKWIFSGKDII